MGIFFKDFFFSLGQLFLAICCTWLHLASPGFWLLALASLGFWPFWLSGLLTFGFTWLYNTLKKSALALSFLAFGSWLLGFLAFGFWLLAFASLRIGLLAFWLFAFGLCERNEDPTI